MRKPNVEILNEDGTHRRWVSHGEAERMEKQGEIVIATSLSEVRRKFRMRPKDDLTKSSPATRFVSVTPSDMRAVAGLERVGEIRLERLIARGLVPLGTAVPKNGYF